MYGAYQPDSIAALEASDGETYLVIANEGDVREISGAENVRPPYGARVSTLTLDPDAFPAALDVKANKNLGRLNVNSSLGFKLVDGKAVHDRLYAYGARSLSIFTTDGKLIYDSGNEFESIIADKVSRGELANWAFNATNSNNFAGGDPGESNITLDSRSDDKGPEPEGVVVRRVGDPLTRSWDWSESAAS